MPDNRKPDGFVPKDRVPRERQDQTPRDRQDPNRDRPRDQSPRQEDRQSAVPQVTRVSDVRNRFGRIDNAAPGHDYNSERDNDRDHGRDRDRRRHDRWDDDHRWDSCYEPSWWHHGRSRWSFGFSIGFGSGVYFSTYDRCWDPCWDPWWHRRVVYYPSYYYWYEPVYYTAPVYRVYYTPNYYCAPWRSTVSYTTVSSSWYSGSTVTTTTTTYNPLPNYDIVEFCDTVASPTPIVYTTTPRVVEVTPTAYEPTIYHSETLAGVLGWNDTPETISAAVGSSSLDRRATTAAEFLGRVPAGGWDVGFEAEKVVNGERQLWFRGLTPNSRGERVLIVVKPKAAYPKLYAGQRVQITGRLEEICIDDPYEQAGRLTLAEGSIRG